MFDGFALDEIDVGEAGVRVRFGGAGPPVLLLHGHPRTHATWHRVAPRLAADFTVVCPDLRGYGGSSKPPSDPDHAPYSKRAMAGDCLCLMRGLGHERFAVAGHDRGAYVAFRLAMDHPDAVRRLAVLDAVPIGAALARADARFAAAWWHWFFLGQVAKPADRLISLDPEGWYRPDPVLMGDESCADLRWAIADPRTVWAMCEDYRAGLGIDRAHDDADLRAGRRIACPTLALWAMDDDLPGLYGDVLGIWREWAADVAGRGLPCGHHIAEELPGPLADELAAFFAA